MNDQEVRIQELKDKVRAFCEARDWDKFHNAKELAIGIVTEGSELLQELRFRTYDEVNTMFKADDERKKLIEEVADILFFLLRLSQMYDIDLTNALTEKIEKNERKYPASEFKGSNLRKKVT